MSAETMYAAVYDTIADQMQLEDAPSAFEIIGILEHIKSDLLTELSADDEEDDAE